ncbi:UvrD-like helicase, ATP-binding domain, P-loop containing nucleoside triphosphate hydrolase [Tanacetum coccineum]
MLDVIDCMPMGIWKIGSQCHARSIRGVIKNLPYYNVEAVASQDLPVVFPYVGKRSSYSKRVLLGDGIYPDVDKFRQIIHWLHVSEAYVTLNQQSKKVHGKMSNVAFDVLQRTLGTYSSTIPCMRSQHFFVEICIAGFIMHDMILEYQNMSVVDWTCVYLILPRSLQTVWIGIDVKSLTLGLPSTLKTSELKNFCTTSTSYKLHTVKMEPLNLLVIDEAAQLKEAESTIPLQLPGVNHAILIGDECQLPAMVKSKVMIRPNLEDNRTRLEPNDKKTLRACCGPIKRGRLYQHSFREVVQRKKARVLEPLQKYAMMLALCTEEDCNKKKKNQGICDIGRMFLESDVLTGSASELSLVVRLWLFCGLRVLGHGDVCYESLLVKGDKLPLAIVNGHS